MKHFGPTLIQEDLNFQPYFRITCPHCNGNVLIAKFGNFKQNRKCAWCEQILSSDRILNLIAISSNQKNS